MPTEGKICNERIYTSTRSREILGSVFETKSSPNFVGKSFDAIVAAIMAADSPEIIFIPREELMLNNSTNDFMASSLTVTFIS